MSRERNINLDIYYYRSKGVEYCKTEGSDHYKKRGIEPIEYAIANNRFEDFAITNIIKYAERFRDTRNPNDLKKVADYAHILCGVELHEAEVRAEITKQILEDMNNGDKEDRKAKERFDQAYVQHLAKTYKEESELNDMDN